MLARFLWKDHTGHVLHWCRKAIIHIPKGRGGHGVRNIRTINDALLMKKAWRIMHHMQLLVTKAFARGTSIYNQWHHNRTMVS